MKNIEKIKIENQILDNFRGIDAEDTANYLITTQEIFFNTQGGLSEEELNAFHFIFSLLRLTKELSTI